MVEINHGFVYLNPQFTNKQLAEISKRLNKQAEAVSNQEAERILKEAKVMDL